MPSIFADNLDYLQVYVPQNSMAPQTYIDTNSSIDFEKLH